MDKIEIFGYIPFHSKGIQLSEDDAKIMIQCPLINQNQQEAVTLLQILRKGTFWKATFEISNKNVYDIYSLHGREIACLVHTLVFKL
jgi:hypothetical protein